MTAISTKFVRIQESPRNAIINHVSSIFNISDCVVNSGVDLQQLEYHSPDRLACFANEDIIPSLDERWGTQYPLEQFSFAQKSSKQACPPECSLKGRSLTWRPCLYTKAFLIVGGIVCFDSGPLKNDAAISTSYRPGTSVEKESQAPPAVPVEDSAKITYCPRNRITYSECGSLKKCFVFSGDCHHKLPRLDIY